MQKLLTLATLGAAAVLAGCSSQRPANAPEQAAAPQAGVWIAAYCPVPQSDWQGHPKVASVGSRQVARGTAARDAPQSELQVPAGDGLLRCQVAPNYVYRTGETYSWYGNEWRARRSLSDEPFPDYGNVP